MRFTHLLVLFLLLVLAIGLSFPLVTQLTTHVPGTDTWAFDEYTFLWSMWYFKFSLIDQISSPLHTDLIFFPLGLDLILYTYNLLGTVLALPLQLVAGVPLASNLINLLATVLSGYGTFLLVRYLLRRGISGVDQPASHQGRDWTFTRDGAALIAGLVFAFASNRAIYLSLGHYNIYHTQWVPFFVLYLIKTLDRARRHDAIMAGLFGGLALLTDMLYGVLLAAIALPLVLFALFRRGSRADPTGPSTRQLLVGVIGIAAVAALVSAVLLVPTVGEGLSGDYALEGWGDAQKLSSDLAGLVTPTDLHPLWGGDWTAELRAVEAGEGRFSDINTLFLGYATLALATIGALAGRRKTLPWVILALLSALFALGPLLQIHGESLFHLDGLDTTVPLPFIITHYLPFIKGYRAPNRFSIPLMLALAVLAGYGVSWIVGRLLSLSSGRGGSRLLLPEIEGSSGRRLLAVAMVLLAGAAIVFEHLAWPMPVTDSRIPAVYQELAGSEGNGTIMQLPMGWRNGFRVFGSEDTRVQWYQSDHKRPIISGNAVRNPPFKFEYFERQPLLQAIAGLEMYQQPDEITDQRARQSADDLVALWNVDYLVVNPPVPGRYPYADTWQAARDYALDVLPVDPEPLWQADGVQVFRVRQPLVPFPFGLDFGTADTSAYRGVGWSADEQDISGATGVWAMGREADLYLPLRLVETRPLRLVLRVQPFSYPDAAPQSLNVRFNGVDLGTRAVTPGWQELAFDVPAEAAVDGLNSLNFSFIESAQPADVLQGQGMIGSSGVQSPVDIEINSGGTAQDIAFITVSDPEGVEQDASSGRRGYNLSVIDPDSGELLAVRGFDTWANEFEAETMADFIEEIEEGVIVVAAVRDDGSRFLTDRAVAALADLGSQVDLRQTPGYGHGLVGVKGASPGSAAEAIGPDGAYLRVAADRRPLSVAFDWLRLEDPR
ncbi:MAG: interleukin-like EMT inducer domain-containing protein [Chloroflexota bacterium]|nr:interleukin-like EMT inducer domain-containing protein [Chloroflexota bacterium]